MADFGTSFDYSPEYTKCLDTGYMPYTSDKRGTDPKCSQQLDQELAKKCSNAAATEEWSPAHPDSADLSTVKAFTYWTPTTRVSTYSLDTQHQDWKTQRGRIGGYGAEYSCPTQSNSISLVLTATEPNATITVNGMPVTPCEDDEIEIALGMFH